MHGDAAPSDALALRKRSPWLMRLVWLLAAAVAVAVVGYVTTHPDELPRGGDEVTATTAAGRVVYVGVFSAPDDFGRTIEISGVKVFATFVPTTPGEVTITPHLCRGGSVGVTSDAAPFCEEVVPTEGATMTAGDEIVLEVTSDVAGVVSIDPVRVAYRDGLQRATQRAGARAVITILG